MSTGSSRHAERFPSLFAPRRAEWAGVDGAFSLESPGPALVTKIHELLEEAGARLTGPLHHVGAFVCDSYLPAPYRPWQPHPHQAWAWATTDVVVDSAPTNPADGEDVVEVRTSAPAEAKPLLAPQGEFVTELVDLSVEIHRSFRSIQGIRSTRP